MIWHKGRAFDESSAAVKRGMQPHIVMDELAKPTRVVAFSKKPRVIAKAVIIETFTDIEKAATACAKIRLMKSGRDLVIADGEARGFPHQMTSSGQVPKGFAETR